ncbi:MAG: translocation/assembly module TamB domain-containing protein [Zetaproteobacteria bacterium]|nr:translocation/assembly module TamB domain-containing protein [Zetaproteobacteria bacterium]
MHRRALSEYGVEVSIGSSEITLFPLGVTLHNISASLSGASSVDQELSRVFMSKVSAKISYWELLLGVFQISEVQIVDGRLRVEEQDALLYLKQAALEAETSDQEAAKKAAEPWWLEKADEQGSFVRCVKLLNFQIEYFFESENPAAGQEGLGESRSGQFSIRQLDAQLDLSSSYEGNLQIDAGHILVSRPGRTQFPEFAIAGMLKLDGGSLQSQKLEIRSGEHILKGELTSELKVDAQRSVLEGWKYSSRWAGDISVKDLGIALDAPMSSGSIDLAAALEGFIPLGDSRMSSTLHFGGDIKGHDVIWDDLRLGAIHSEVYSDGKHLWLKNIRLLRQDKEVLWGDGKVGLVQDIPISLSLVPQDVSLAEILGVFGSGTDAVDFNFVAGRLKLEGHLSPLKLRLSGHSDIQNVTINPLTRTGKEGLYSSQPLPKGQGELDLSISSRDLIVHRASILFDGPLRPSSSANGTEATVLDIQGRFDYSKQKSGMDLGLSSPNLDLALLEPYFAMPIGGRGGMEVRIAGDFKDRIVTSLSLNMRDVYTENVDLHTVVGEVDFYADHLRWKNMRLWFADGGEIYSARGKLFYKGLGIENVLLSTRKIGFSAMRLLEDIVFVDIPLVMRKADIRCNLKSGELLRPGSWIGDFSLAVQGWKFGKWGVSGTSRFKGKATSDLWSLQDIQITHAGHRVVGLFQVPRRRQLIRQHSTSWLDRFGFDPEESFVAFFQLMSQPGISLPDPYELYSVHPDIYQWMSRYELSGQWEGDLTFTGKLSQPEGKFKLKIGDAVYRSAKLGALVTQATFVGSQLEGNLDYDSGSGIGRFKLDLAEQSLPFDFYLRFKQLDLRPLLVEDFAEDPRNFAYADGEWAFNSSVAHPWKGTGRIELKGINVKYLHKVGSRMEHLRLFSTNRAAFLMKSGGRWSMDPTLDPVWNIRGTQAQFELRLAPSVVPADFRLRGSGRVNMALARSVMEQVDLAQGALHLDFETKGSIFSPSWRLDIEDSHQENGDDQLILGLGKLKPAFKNIQFKASIEDGLVKVDHFSANKGKGGVQVDGVFDLMQNRPSRLQLEFDRTRFMMPLPFLRTLDFEVAGNMVLSGEKRPYQLKGDMRVAKAASIHNGEFVTDVISGLRQASVMAASIDGETQKPMVDMAVRFRADRSILVRNKNMNVVGSGDFVLIGSPTKPNLRGKILVDNGYLFYKHRFDIQVGELVFDHPSKIDPKMNLMAVTNISDYRVGLNITGEASRSNAELLVDPATHPDGTPISPTDAFLLLSTGSLPNRDSQAADEALGVGLSEVLNNVFAQGKVPFEKLSEKVGQDAIRLYPDFTVDENGNTVPQVNAVVKLFDQIEASGRSSTGGRWEVTLEVPVHSQVSVLGSVNQEQTSTGHTSNERSVDLKFRFPVKQ